MPIAFWKNAIGLPPCTQVKDDMRTNIMISSLSTHCDFCHVAILARVSASRKNSLAQFPLPELKLGDRQRSDFFSDFFDHTEVIKE